MDTRSAWADHLDQADDPLAIQLVDASTVTLGQSRDTVQNPFSQFAVSQQRTSPLGTSAAKSEVDWVDLYDFQGALLEPADCNHALPELRSGWMPLRILGRAHIKEVGWSGVRIQAKSFKLVTRNMAQRFIL